MTEQIKLSWQDCLARAREVAKKIRADCGHSDIVTVFGIPNGGIPAALLVQGVGPKIKLTTVEQDADVFVDDIVDSGATRSKWETDIRPFYCLVDKLGKDNKRASFWFSFPWERMAKQEGPRENIVRILQYLGEDVDREGLRETPDRVVRSFGEIYCGYEADPASLLKTFDGEKYDEMVMVRDIEFYSMCEHHMMPFFGKAHIAYIPNGPIIGASKLARLVEIFSRRLQNQERLTMQITSWIDDNLLPLGAGCRMEAKHLCMSSRGVGKQGSCMVTSSLTGVFRERPEVRQEFFSLIR